MSEENNKALEFALKKLIEEADKINEVSDIYVAFIRQMIINSYCEN